MRVFKKYNKNILNIISSVYNILTGDVVSFRFSRPNVRTQRSDVHGRDPTWRFGCASGGMPKPRLRRAAELRPRVGKPVTVRGLRKSRANGSLSRAHVAVRIGFCGRRRRQRPQILRPDGRGRTGGRPERGRGLRHPGLDRPVRRHPLCCTRRPLVGIWARGTEPVLAPAPRARPALRPARGPHVGRLPLLRRGRGRGAAVRHQHFGHHFRRDRRRRRAPRAGRHARRRCFLFRGPSVAVRRATGAATAQPTGVRVEDRRYRSVDQEQRVWRVCGMLGGR